MYKTVLVLLVFLASVSAETLRTGTIYTGPLKLTAPNLGASFRLPEAWDGGLVGPEGPLVLQSDGRNDRILMEGNISVAGDPAALLPEKRDYYGLRLFSPTQIKRMRPSLYYRLYQVEGSDDFSSCLLYVLLGSQGRAVLLYGFFGPGGYGTMRRTLMTLANTVAFTPIKALPGQMTNLYMTLAGGHYVFYERKGSYSEKREIWLCRDGRVLLRGTYTVANNTSRSTLMRRGKWRLESEALVTEFNDGTAERYRVSKMQNTLMFDKAQVFRLPNHACE